MDDIMQATGLSRGGLYHHYSSTYEIMYDLMSDGSKYREKMIRQTLRDGETANINNIVKILIDKMLADNDYVPVYVMFLSELKNDNKLKGLYHEIKRASIAAVKQLFTDFGYGTPDDDVFEFVINLINASLMACELLDTRPNFIANKNRLAKMLEAYFQTVITEKRH